MRTSLAAPTRLVPFSYFCNCWNEMPSSRASALCDRRCASRWMRMLAPTTASPASALRADMFGLLILSARRRNVCRNGRALSRPWDERRNVGTKHRDSCTYSMLTSKSTQQNISQQLIRMLVERILAEVLPGDTGAARLQQIGLFTLVYMLQGDKEPVTAARLASMTGQPAGDLSVQLKKLIDLDLIDGPKTRK